MKILSLVIAMAFSFNSTKNRGGLETKFNGQTFEAQLNEGFHFNLEAPNKVVIDGKNIPAIKIRGRQAQYGPLPSTWGEGQASLYVCDDAVTFCEPNFITLNTQTNKVSPPKDALTEKNQLSINVFGFIEDDLNHALQVAKQQGRLILLDFSARWCPGCVRYESETFPTSDFQQLTKPFVKVKIDVDKFENQILTKKFNVRGIPTLLVINTDQEEIDRLVDYQPSVTLKNFFDTITKDPRSISALKKDADKNKETRENLAKRLVMAGNYKESLKYFTEGSSSPSYLEALVKDAQRAYATDPKQKDFLLTTLKEAVQSEPKSSRSLAWRTNLLALGLNQAETEKVLNEGIQVANHILEKPDRIQKAVVGDLVGEYTMYEDFFVAIRKADLIEAGRGPDHQQTKEAWLDAAKLAEKHKIKAKNFGPALRYLIILVQAKEYEKAEKLSAELLKLQPNHGDLERRRFKILLELGRNKEAIALGNKALKNSYGRNEFWVAEFLAKAYVANGDYDEASSLIKKYLGRNDADWTNLSSTKTNLENLQTQIARLKMPKQETKPTMPNHKTK